MFVLVKGRYGGNAVTGAGNRNVGTEAHAGACKDSPSCRQRLIAVQRASGRSLSTLARHDGGEEVGKGEGASETTSSLSYLASAVCGESRTHGCEGGKGRKALPIPSFNVRLPGLEQPDTNHNKR